MKVKYITQIVLVGKWIDMTFHYSYKNAKEDAISLKDTDGNNIVRIIKRSDEIISYLDDSLDALQRHNEINKMNGKLIGE